MTPPAAPLLRLWELIDQAMDCDDVTALHLLVGRPPMIRIAGKGIHPLPGSFPVLTFQTIQVMLCTVVEPELWDQFERTGEGEIPLTPPAGGRPITLTLFRSSEAWSAVVHF